MTQRAIDVTIEKIARAICAKSYEIVGANDIEREVEAYWDCYIPHARAVLKLFQEGL